MGLVVVEIPMFGITRRRSGHATETRVHSNHVRPPGESSRPQPNAAGDTGRCQRFVPSPEDIEPPAPVGRRRDQPGVRLVTERLRSGPRNLFRAMSRPALACMDWYVSRSALGTGLARGGDCSGPSRAQPIKRIINMKEHSLWLDVATGGFPFSFLHVSINGSRYSFCPRWTAPILVPGH